VSDAGTKLPESARLRFTTWRDDDMPRALRIWGDARVTKHILGRTPREAEVRVILDRNRDWQASVGVQYWPLERRDDGAFVGCCGMRPRDDEAGVWELGFAVVPEQQRQGFAREAARAVIAFAFDELGARELFAGHHPDNAVSPLLLAELGFRYTHTELYEPTGREHPSYRLRPEDAPGA
jgi:ribosomal-protein-alanine N-acetyltransferase